MERQWASEVNETEGVASKFNFWGLHLSSRNSMTNFGDNLEG